MEAVRTNIIGTTNNVITATVENHVERVVFLSTDKVAYPIDVNLVDGIGEAKSYISAVSLCQVANEFDIILMKARKLFINTCVYHTDVEYVTPFPKADFILNTIKLRILL